MASPTDLVKDYMTARLSRVPQTPYTQEQSERYSAEAEDGNNDEYRKRREEEEEEDVSRETFEKNAREAEREIEFNSRQRELDDLDDDLAESEPYDEDNHLEDTEFSGAYFEKPDESEQKESLGNRIRAKYDSFRASASDTAESLSSTFGASFGAAAGAASAKYSRFKRGDPIFSVQSPVRRGKNPYTRSISRAGRSISRPYVGGRFNDSLTLGINAGYNPYYPVNDGRQSFSSDEPRDLYLPSGTNPYEGEFSGRNAFKQSEFSDERKRYDPFGFGVDGRLSADGFNNMSGEFGDSLLGGVGNRKESSIFGGMSAGTDTVFGDGAMFNANRAKGKKEMSGFGLDMIIGNNGGMFNTIDPSPRKTTTKRRKSASKIAKKSTKKATKRKQNNGFVLP